jgi:hypothetical protein
VSGQGGGSRRLAWMDDVIGAEDEGIDAYAVAVAFVLYKHMDREGSCRPSTRRVADLARCSQRVALERIDRLEAAGLLAVDRRHRAVSHYRAITPGSDTAASAYAGEADQQNSDTESATAYAETADSGNPQDLLTEDQQTDALMHSSADPETESAYGASVRTKEPLTTPPLRRAKRRAPIPDTWPKGKKVGGDDFWRFMAKRSLKVERECKRCDIPEGARHREDPWIDATAASFREQHEEKAKRLRDRLPLGDAERFIYELEPTLSKHGWGPDIEAAMRKQAEAEPYVPPTEEERAQMKADLEAAKAEVRRLVASQRHEQDKRDFTVRKAS